MVEKIRHTDTPKPFITRNGHCLVILQQQSVQTLCLLSVYNCQLERQISIFSLGRSVVRAKVVFIGISKCLYYIVS